MLNMHNRFLFTITIDVFQQLSKEVLERERIEKQGESTTKRA